MYGRGTKLSKLKKRNISNSLTLKKKKQEIKIIIIRNHLTLLKTENRKKVRKKLKQKKELLKG